MARFVLFSYPPAAEGIAMDPEQADEGVPGDDAAKYAEESAWFESDVPEYYSDTINVQTGTYGLSLTFGVRGWRGPNPKARVFMSHEMAKVIHLLLKRVLTTYEVENGVKIAVPESVLAALKLRDVDFEELLHPNGTPAGQESR